VIRGARAQVLVLAKHPTPGAVKTRLAAVIGAEAACRLHHAFVVDLAARLANTGLPVTWAFWPPDAPFATLVAPAPCVPQVAGDLGERLDAAIRQCFERRPLPVIALGADSPQLDLGCLQEAAVALADGADVVLGPALDGGYYLIGLRAPDSRLFTGIPWGSAAVFEATLASAGNRRVRLLPPTFDVDDAAGLAALCAVVESGAVHLPNTARALRTIVTPPSCGGP
jgi:rSAM/selenodomain-associated transferase 1